MRIKKRNRNHTRGEQVKTLQMLLWTIVIIIQMTVVKSLEVKAETDFSRELTIPYPVMNSREACKKPEDTWQDESGTEYELAGWRVEPAVASPAEKRVEKHVRYDQTEGNAVLPETIEIQVQDRTRGQTVTACLWMEKKELVAEEWTDGFVFLVTFHTYGAEYYHLADRLIPYNEERPELAGCEELLLETIGVPAEDYRINHIRWAGESYEDADGNVCRDASAFGQKRIRDYRVTYSGTAEFPEWNGWQTVAVYRPFREAVETAQTMPELILETETVKRVTESTEVPPESRYPSLWERITRTLMITIAIGAVLFLGGLLFLLLLQVAKKVQACYNRRKTKQKKEQTYVHRK